MKLITVILVSLTFALQVAGTVAFKIAMDETSGAKAPRTRKLSFAGGILAMALGFFIGLSQLSEIPLSKYYPFEGIERVVVLIAAAIFLREKITPRVVLGVALICRGLFLVAG